jgi:hypothetical protein
MSLSYSVVWALTARAAGIQLLDSDPSKAGAIWYPCAAEPQSVRLGGLAVPFSDPLRGVKACPVTGTKLPFLSLMAVAAGSGFTTTSRKRWPTLDCGGCHQPSWRYRQRLIAANCGEQKRGSVDPHCSSERDLADSFGELWDGHERTRASTQVRPLDRFNPCSSFKRCQFSSPWIDKMSNAGKIA